MEQRPTLGSSCTLSPHKDCLRGFFQCRRLGPTWRGGKFLNIGNSKSGCGSDSALGIDSGRITGNPEIIPR